MWLFTTFGFFSIVEKPEDCANDTLTIRSRVRKDLEVLRELLPELSPIVEHAGTDYQFRATAPRGALARAMQQLVNSLNYDNFKHEVQVRQGPARAQVYSKVWGALWDMVTSKVRFSLKVTPSDE